MIPLSVEFMSTKNLATPRNSSCSPAKLAKLNPISVSCGSWVLRSYCAFAVSAAAIRFNNGVSGKLSAGWTVAMTHDGALPRWEKRVGPIGSPHRPFSRSCHKIEPRAVLRRQFGMKSRFTMAPWRYQETVRSLSSSTRNGFSRQTIEPWQDWPLDRSGEHNVLRRIHHTPTDYRGGMSIPAEV